MDDNNNNSQQPYNQQPNNQQSNNQQPNNQQTNNQQYNQQQYNQQAYTPPPAYNPQNQYNNGQQLEPTISLGQWVIIMLLMAIPCVNIIMLFIWAFGRDVNTSKKNYSRAMLIFYAVAIVLGLIFGSVIGAMFSSIANNLYY